MATFTHVEDAMDGMDINHNESDDDEAGWEECEEDIVTMATCLFCQQSFRSANETFDHCSAAHSFSLQHIQQLHQLDCFSYIKMINYIRKHNPDVRDINRPMAHQMWGSDDYMKPVLPDDPLLTYDIEDELGEVEMDCATQNIGNGYTAEDAVTLSRSDYSGLLRRLEAAEKRATQTEEQLQQTVEDLNKVRSVARKVMLSQPDDRPPSEEVTIRSIKEDDDNPYFSSYGHYSIHEQMLKDKVRTESYRDSILGNPELFTDKVVLDIGCGSGILSMFAAQAGAKHVIGIDLSEIIYQAMDIVRENGFEQKITLIKGKVEEVDLPVEKVDVIISEWMGYFLLFESMLDTVLYARDKWLAEGGVVIPDQCNISLIGSCDRELHDRSIGFWDDVYGFKMTSLKNEVIKEANVMVVSPDKIATEPAVLKEIDVSSCMIKDLEFSCPFSLKATSNEEITAFIGYFDIRFTKGLKKVEFSTGPKATSTHWKQTVFLLPSPIKVNSGDEVDGQLICKKKRGDPRSLVITISVKNQIFKYIME